MRHVEVHEYGDDVEQANTAYSTLEDEHAGGKYEVVLVGADSIDTIKRTHSPYFSTGPRPRSSKPSSPRSSSAIPRRRGFVPEVAAPRQTPI
jgi:hypothetical protein